MSSIFLKDGYCALIIFMYETSSAKDIVLFQGYPVLLAFELLPFPTPVLSYLDLIMLGDLKDDMPGEFG